MSQRPKPRTLGAILAATMRPASSHADTERVMRTVHERYPVTRKVNAFVVDSRGLPSAHGGGLEYYPATENSNPLPGLNAVELFDSGLEGELLNRAVAGDVLHGLPDYDPAFGAMRSEFRDTITPEQRAFDEKAYARGRESHDTFDSWMDRSQLDAYIRGYLFPDKNAEWIKEGVYTPTQRVLLEKMRAYLGAGGRGIGAESMPTSRRMPATLGDLLSAAASGGLR
jgi:hypothetical protein